MENKLLRLTLKETLYSYNLEHIQAFIEYNYPLITTTEGSLDPDQLLTEVDNTKKYRVILLHITGNKVPAPIYIIKEIK